MALKTIYEVERLFVPAFERRDLGDAQAAGYNEALDVVEAELAERADLWESVAIVEHGARKGAIDTAVSISGPGTYRAIPVSHIGEAEDIFIESKPVISRSPHAPAKMVPAVRLPEPESNGEEPTTRPKPRSRRSRPMGVEG